MNINNMNNANMFLQNNALHRMENIERNISSSNTSNVDFSEILNNIEDLKNDIPQRDTSDIKKAAIEMETYFLNEMFKAMRRTIPEATGMFEKSNAERIWQDMLDEETAKNLANSGGVGLAQMMYSQLTRNM
ncbi:MAG: rod-binding protein [Defluviitaleaceae bacterium]|nr:rod-binding protein [Defluviitaleaceae bacterium]